MYLGNQPALSYTSFAKQDFTTSATTSYTLDNPVANANELALFINFVRQEPTTAYSASGTSLTLTSATSATDDMYCVYLGKAVQTVNPPNASVGTAQIADLAVTSGKLASGVLPTNTPAFEAYLSSTQSISDGVSTKVNIDTENFDTNSNFASNKFTPTVAGKYFIYGSTVGYAGAVSDLVSSQAMIYKNGSYHAGGEENYNTNLIQRSYNTVSTIVDMNGSSDYVELYGYVNGNSGGGESFYVQAGLAKCNLFGGYKIIE